MQRMAVDWTGRGGHEQGGSGRRRCSEELGATAFNLFGVSTLGMNMACMHAWL